MNSNKKEKVIRQKRFNPKKLIILAVILICAGAALLYYLFDGTDKSAYEKLNQTAVSSSQSVCIASNPSSREPESSVSDYQSSEIDRVTLQEAKKPLWIKVTVANQKSTIFDSDNKTVQSFVCSTGKEGDETPIGTFTIKERGKSFFSNTYHCGAYYWTQFKDDFLFHSIPFDKNKNIDEVEAAKLGNRASHGCVRLSIEDAKWIYDNIPRGTKVVIEE